MAHEPALDKDAVFEDDRAKSIRWLKERKKNVNQHGSPSAGADPVPNEQRDRRGSEDK